jgi:phosphoribosylaminoimidazolecarboxamide formyltransferase/IMP cyclohydrolase
MHVNGQKNRLNKGVIMAAPNALLSVYNKDGIVEFARGLVEQGFKLYASGGTRQAITDAKIAVTDVADLTGFGAILDHRVVTLHPNVHGGILADTSKPEHLKTLKDMGIPLFSLVCVDMYPFEAELDNPKATPESIIEKIDIGGPTMINAAAKSGRIVLTRAEQRQPTIDWLKAGKPNESEYLAGLAAQAFYETNRYYQSVVRHTNGNRVSAFIAQIDSPTKYGENPQQAEAAFYADNRLNPDPLGLDQFQHIQGMEKSFINMTDLDRLLQTSTHIVAGFERNFKEVPFLAVGVKHGNACGAAVAKNHVEAVKMMLEGDDRAIFGGVVMINGEISKSVAEVLMNHLMPQGQKRLLDGVVGSAVTDEALELLNRSKLRVVVNPALGSLTQASLDTCRRKRPVRGGMLEQPNYDFVQDLKSVESYGTISSQQKRDAILGWAIGCTSNSNTITLVKNGQLIGNGVGQQDRIGAGQLAISRTTTALPEFSEKGDELILKIRLSKNKLSGAVAYSDSFFPFPDGPTILAQAGIKAILTSSGSVGDKAVQEAMTKAGVSLMMIPDKVGRGFYSH